MFCIGVGCSRKGSRQHSV